MDDELRSLHDGEGGQEEEDLFGDSSDFSLPDPDDLLADLEGDLDQPLPEMDDDPFATLDEVVESDPFASLEAPPETERLVAEEPTLEAHPTEPLPAPEPPPPSDDLPDWLRQLGVGEEDISFEEEAAPAEEEAPAAAAEPRMLFGLTAAQRMILSIFLFLDVAVLSFAFLYALGAIAF